MNAWLRQMMPDEYVTSIYHIDLDKLWRSGKRLLLSDLDNTLVPYNHPDVPQELAGWLQKATDIGFDVCLISNNKGDRVDLFARSFGVSAIGAAHKPRPHAFLQAMEQFGRGVQETVMIGDQLFTDVRGGNLCGLYTILVLPMNNREWWGTRVVRRVERLAMKRLVRQGLDVPPHENREVSGR